MTTESLSDRLQLLERDILLGYEQNPNLEPIIGLFFNLDDEGHGVCCPLSAAYYGAHQCAAPGEEVLNWVSTTYHLTYAQVREIYAGVDDHPHFGTGKPYQFGRALYQKIFNNQEERA